MDLVDKTIEFCLTLEWADLPGQVQHQAKRCLLDLMGALIAGTDTPAGRLMADFANRQFAGSEATILAGGKSSAVGAALANGFSANALDIDDGYRLIKGHPGACVLPVLLAAAEMAHSSGPDFLTALVIGYETGIRAGLIRHALYETYHSSGSWGAVAGAAAAGRLLGLTGPALANALGAAEYHAPIAPMMKGIDRPSMGKDSIGWGCLTAMAGVLMVEQGFTGITPLFAEAPDESWILELGSEYRMIGLYFKPYAACRWGQPAVAGALKLKSETGLSPPEIKRIMVRTFTAAARLDNAPPQNTEQAQYNLAWPVAAALFDGEVGPVQVLPPRIFDSDLISLAARVQVTAAPEFDREFPARALAETIIETRDGQRFSSGILPAKWEPPDIPSDRALEDKFLWLAAPVIGPESAAKLAALIWRLEEEVSIGDLIQLATRVE